MIAEEIEVDPRAHTAETAVRVTTEGKTLGSPSDPGTTIRGVEALAEMRGNEVQADGEDRDRFPLPGHESRPDLHS